MQIRHVPDDVHRTLRERAKQEGLSLSDYLRRELESIARRPTLEDVLAAIEADEPIHLSTDTASLIREIRDGR